MRKAFVAIAFLIAPFMVFCQTNLANELIAITPASADDGTAKIQQHIENLQSKKSKKDLTFLHKIFWSTQQKFLKTYSPYVAFGELFSSGKYDCLTATSLYSLILSEFKYDFDIIETNYHIFIIVHTSSGEVLLETTDRFNGFVQNKKEIEERIGSYKENLIAVKDSNKSFLQYSFSLYNKISPEQLTGLLHFNQAVNAFNTQQWLACADELVLSKSKYDSPRIKELALLLVQSVLSSNANEEIQELITQRFKPYWLEKQQVMVSN